MEDKIVIKPKSFPGVDRALFDIQVGPKKIRITGKLFKRGLTTYVPLEGHVLAGEVLRMGNLSITYRVKGGNAISENENLCFPIQRVDGFNITNTDINAVIPGKYATVVNRKTFQQELELRLQILNKP
jgi:hypothetical protein